MLIFLIRKFIFSALIIVGVTFISFFLIVYCSPEKTYDLLGKNPTQKEIEEIRHQLGYNKPFLIRYFNYVYQLISFDFGSSYSSGEKVSSILKRTIPVSLLVELPGFIIGNLISIILALFLALYRGRFFDRLITSISVIVMSLSFVIVVIVFQIIFCSTYGLNLFPVFGWNSSSLIEYLKHVTVPTLCMIFTLFGYNIRFYRSIFLEELESEYVRTARAFGLKEIFVLMRYVFPNSLIPILTRIVFMIPFLIVGGSLVLETYFGIPGVGLATYEAAVTGDENVLKAIIGISATLYVFVIFGTDILYKFLDPRVNLKCL